MMRRCTVVAASAVKWTRYIVTLSSSDRINQLHSFEKYISDKVHSPQYEDSVQKQKNLQKALDSEDVWSNSDEYVKVTTQLSQVSKTVTAITDLQQEVNEVIELYKLSLEDNDQDATDECLRMIDMLNEKVSKLQLLDVMSSPTDRHSCFIQILAGAGGTEACDWTLMLSEMYQRWSGIHDYSMTVVDEQRDADSGGGYRNVTFLCTGN